MPRPLEVFTARTHVMTPGEGGAERTAGRVAKGEPAGIPGSLWQIFPRGDRRLGSFYDANKSREDNLRFRSTPVRARGGRAFGGAISLPEALAKRGVRRFANRRRKFPKA